MIGHRDFGSVSAGEARGLLRAMRAAACEELAHELRVRSLDRVMEVILRLTALASTATCERREVLLGLADELDEAVRGARQVVLGRADPSGPAASAAATERVEVALVDRAGVIVWTNRAWDEFCVANGGDPGRAGVGRSYLAFCDEAGDRPSADVARAIREAVHGNLPAPVRILVPCPSPDRPRRFDVLVSSRHDDDGRVAGATVTLSEP
ncbi:MAG TPA: PAS domain-containing protein [Actinomycetospora sp.]|uniref:PAS domain-containing protein n=1 Tax=Actinomycetospora sp. TaxID=1872135 RepID=UPI002F3F14CE